MFLGQTLVSGCAQTTNNVAHDLVDETTVIHLDGLKNKLYCPAAEHQQIDQVTDKGLLAAASHVPDILPPETVVQYTIISLAPNKQQNQLHYINFEFITCIHVINILYVAMDMV